MCQANACQISGLDDPLGQFSWVIIGVAALLMMDVMEFSDSGVA